MTLLIGRDTVSYKTSGVKRRACRVVSKYHLGVENRTAARYWALVEDWKMSGIAVTAVTTAYVVLIAIFVLMRRHGRKR